MSIGIVMLGAGDFAVEVATYIADIACRLLQEQHDGPSEWTVTDIVAPDAGRIDDIEKTLGGRPNFHTDIATVAEIQHKSAVICVADPPIRHRIFQDLQMRDVKCQTVIHPSVYVARTAEIGDGCILCPFVFVGAFAKIEENVALNVRCSIGHDAVIRQSSVLSSGSILNGHARCGTAAFLGTGATLFPHTTMGNYSKLSAGSVLTKSVGDGFLMHGNPAAGRQMIKIP